MAQAYGTTGAPGIFEILNTMSETFNKLTNPCEELRKTLKPDFDIFFNYCTKEFIGVTNYLKDVLEKRIEFIVTQSKLNKKKEYHFERKIVNEWQLQKNLAYPKELLLTDKKLAFTYMFPAETENQNKLRNKLGYYANKSVEEYQRLCKKDIKRFKDRFNEAASKHSEILNKVFLNYIVDQ